MNLDEMLRSSLRTVAREVEVSEEDLAHAQHRFIHRREQLERRHHRAQGLVAAAVVGALALGGTLGWRELAERSPEPQPAGRPVVEPPATVLPTSVDSLAGIWLLTSDASGWLWSFHRDGTVSFANPSHRGLESGEPVDYSVGDGVVELPRELCDWQVRITDDGHMVGRVVRAPDPPGSPCGGVDIATWVRVSPLSEVGAGLVWTGSGPVENAEAARWHQAPTAVESVARISRTWLQQGTGRLLSIVTPGGVDDGQYVLDDGGELFVNPDDTGTVTRDATGRLRLTSGDGSRGCPEGSSAVLGGLQLRGIAGAAPPAPAPSLEMTLESAECSLHEELGGVWVQVS
ncbi:hypothetical protein [Ornithinimicrobium pekingense]|uniref:DUF4384 domain-containing protein n=1 Tax=Ornithinimicrobium pekingense TaxID=384677 RepID=A0ABQ2F8E5_9MICO|nr:hypothetical protein [Ornithinimicrobium pekingense]GGK69904.1 hypothetical protein GCM10011509_17900 [Ornithinimicrobium pekingense]